MHLKNIDSQKQWFVYWMRELLCQLDELLTLKLPVNLYCKGFCHTLGSWLELSWTKTGQNKRTLGVPQPWNWWFSKIRWLIVWLNKTIQRCYPDDCHQVYPRTESFMGPSTLVLLTRLLISNTLCSYFLFPFPCPLACFSHLYAVGLGRLENQLVWKANNYLSSRAWWGAGWRGGRGGWRPSSREEPNPSRAQVPPSYWAGPLFGTCQEWGWLARPRTWSVEAGGLGATEETDSDRRRRRRRRWQCVCPRPPSCSTGSSCPPLQGDYLSPTTRLLLFVCSKREQMGEW